MTLGLLSNGEQCEILEIKHCGGCGGGCHDGLKKHDHGGKRVEMLQNDGDLLLLLVDDARIAIDRRMAHSINVKEISAWN